MDTIVMPITGKKVKIALTDFPKIMCWEDAHNACKALGKGWRLPTMDELEQIAKQLDEIGGFCSLENSAMDDLWYQCYWSSDRYGDCEDWYQYAQFTKDYFGNLDFKNDGSSGRQNHHMVESKVRAVKTVR
jgi:hypothetical protein